MSYLKALGIFRLLGEQTKDTGTRAWWKDEVFQVETLLDNDGLVSFFLQQYIPTPIVVPWSGSTFFEVDRSHETKTYRQTPTGAQIIEAFLNTVSERLKTYRDSIECALVSLDECGITSKKDMEKSAKSLFINCLRSSGPSELVNWIDTAAILSDEKATFSFLLGSGGGSDGRAHFSDNFMQNLWEVLPDFDAQRASRISIEQRSRSLLRAALFGDKVRDLVTKRTSSLFDSGAVGGPNATQGFERDALANPWNIVLALEGAVCFAGAATKRIANSRSGNPTFPFQFRMTVTNVDNTGGEDNGGGELWLPIWHKSTLLSEIRQLIAEGRAEVGNRVAQRGVDMVRAVTSLGVDRGVASFRRYAVVKGRVGGTNYNTAVSLGTITVRERASVDLLCEIDPWLREYRKACSSKSAPPQSAINLGRIDSAVFDFCRFGGAARFGNLLCALGRAERHLSMAERWRGENPLRPIGPLSSSWLVAANDGTLEFRLAVAASGIFDSEFKTNSLRTNLEAVELRTLAPGKQNAIWADKNRSTVWNAARLDSNLAAVFERRLFDGEMAGCTNLPLASRYGVPLQAIAILLTDGVDEGKLIDLLWGLILVKQESNSSNLVFNKIVHAPPLSRAYALLKLLFLPRPLLLEDEHGERKARFSRRNELGLSITPEPQLLTLLKANRLGEACAIAARRLRASGLVPLLVDWNEFDGPEGLRLAASLLFPIQQSALTDLVNHVTRIDAV